MEEPQSAEIFARAVARGVNKHARIGFKQAKCNVFANEPTMTVAAVGVETVTRDGAPVAFYVSDDCNQRACQCEKSM